MKWQKRLSKKDHEHLKQMDINTLADTKKSVAHQASLRFPCWDCVNIGWKLGFEIKLTAFHKKE